MDEEGIILTDEDVSSTAIIKAEDNEALCSQLAILDNSQSMIRTVLLGVAMQYKAIDDQRCLLLEGKEIGKDIKSMQIAASLIVLWALLGFQCQAQSIAEQTCAAGVCPDNTELTAGALVITAALMRLFKLASPQKIAGTPEQQEAEELEELVAETEPAI